MGRDGEISMYICSYAHYARARDDGRARWREKFTQKCGRIWLIMRYSCNLFIGLIPQLHSQTAMKMKSPNLFIINSLCNTLIRKSYDNCICIRFLWQSQWRLGSMEERAHDAMVRQFQHSVILLNTTRKSAMRDRVTRSQYLSWKKICSTHSFPYAVVETLHEPISHCALPRRVKLFPLFRFVHRSRDSIRTPVLGSEAGVKLWFVKLYLH